MCIHIQEEKERRYNVSDFGDKRQGYTGLRINEITSLFFYQREEGHDTT
jgi:hypothetical protein